MGWEPPPNRALVLSPCHTLWWTTSGHTNTCFSVMHSYEWILKVNVRFTHTVLVRRVPVFFIVTPYASFPLSFLSPSIPIVIFYCLIFTFWSLSPLPLLWFIKCRNSFFTPSYSVLDVLNHPGIQHHCSGLESFVIVSFTVITYVVFFWQYVLHLMSVNCDYGK